MDNATSNPVVLLGQVDEPDMTFAHEIEAFQLITDAVNVPVRRGNGSKTDVAKLLSFAQLQSTAPSCS